MLRLNSLRRHVTLRKNKNDKKYINFKIFGRSRHKSRHNFISQTRNNEYISILEKDFRICEREKEYVKNYMIYLIDNTDGFRILLVCFYHTLSYINCFIQCVMWHILL